MPLRVLKSFGLDVQAHVDEITANIERRVERATGEVKHAAEAAVVTAAIAVFAAVTASIGLAVGMFALDRWVAQNYGEYQGYGVVCGILGVITLILVVIALVRSKSQPSRTVAADQLRSASAGAANRAAAVPPPVPVRPVPVRPVPLSASVAAPAEPLTRILSTVINIPPTGNAAVDELIDNLRAGARGAGQEALDGAVNVVREGDRINLVGVLAGAVVFGWLVSRSSQR
jgi:uncharacterized membrane protein